MKSVKKVLAGYKPIDQRKSRIITFEGQRRKTKFSDREVVGICGGLKNSAARQLWARDRLNKQHRGDAFAAHIYAMNTIQEVRIDTVAFLLTLPALPFGAGATPKAFAISDNLKAKKQNPFLRLVDRSGIKYSISFYYESITEMRQTTNRYGDIRVTHSYPYTTGNFN